MKYTAEIEINRPVEKVIELFDNPDNMDKWMKGLTSFEHLSGTPGQPGAKSRLKFDMGKRKIEMIETVISRNLPEEFTGSYDVDGVHNIVINRFVPLSENRTKYINECEFRFNNFMMKFFGIVMPGMFKKQTMKFMSDFKDFAEKS